MADPIKEFLIALGFKVNQSSLQGFHSAVGNASKAVGNLGSQLTAVGSAAATSAKRLAATFGLSLGALTLAAKRLVTDFEELYYAVQRTGSSADKLLEFRYAAAQIGLGFGGLEEQVKSLFRTIRLQPGVEQWMNQTGISTRKANGQLRDTTDILADVAEWYGRMVRMGQEPIASRIVEQWGLDPDTLRQTAINIRDLRAATEAYQEKLRLAGLNSQQVAETSRNFMNTLRSLFGTLEVTWARIAQELLPFLGEKLKELDAWLTAHQKEITEYLVDGVQSFVKIMKDPETWTKIKENLTDLKDAFLAVAHVVGLIVQGIKWLSTHKPEDLFNGLPGTPEFKPKVDQPEHSWIWGKIKGWWNGTAATGEMPGEGTGNAFLASQRSGFKAELDRNPELKRRLAAIIDLENPGAGTAVAESLMNRMAMTGGTIASGIGGGARSFYGPVRRGEDIGRLAELERNPERLAARMKQIDQALAGSNIIRGYTDQGSKGDPNYEAGGVGININGERFNDFGVAGARAFREAQQRQVEGGGTSFAANAWDAMKNFGTTFGETGSAMAAPLAPPPLTPLAITGGGASLNQTNNINVTGHDAPATARAIGDVMARTNADMLRYLRGAVDPVSPRSPTTDATVTDTNAP